MSDLLVSARLTMGGQSIHEELPAELRLLKVKRRGLRVGLFEQRRRGTLSKSSDGGCGNGSCFWPDHLRIAVVGRHTGLVFTVLRINQKVKPAVTILKLGQKVCF